MAASRTWTDEQLIEAVSESFTMAEVTRHLGLRSTTSRVVIQRHIERLQLDQSHFKGQAWSKDSRKRSEELVANLFPRLRKGKRVHSLRDRLIASGLKEAKCERCGVVEWQGEPAPLQVDHIDGDHLNNELTNLRILCANCHMLTETWGFKNGRRRPQALVV